MQFVRAGAQFVAIGSRVALRLPRVHVIN